MEFQTICQSFKKLIPPHMKNYSWNVNIKSYPPNKINGSNAINYFYVWFKKFALDADFVIFEKPGNISPVFQTKFCLFVNFTTRIVVLVGSSAICPNDVARLFPYTYVHMYPANCSNRYMNCSVQQLVVFLVGHESTTYLYNYIHECQ